MDYLKLKKIFHWRANTTGIFDPTRKVFRKSPNTMKGVADIVAIKSSSHLVKYVDKFPVQGKAIFEYSAMEEIGRIVCIEVKSAKGKLSPDQEAFKQNIEANGGIYLLARSVEDVKAVFP
jgi:hypothetical protein